MSPNDLSHDQMRDEYQWASDFWNSGRRCRQCNHRVDSWTEDVPCCGAPYECVDTLYVYACHHCRLMGDSF